MRIVGRLCAQQQLEIPEYIEGCADLTYQSPLSEPGKCKGAVLEQLAYKETGLLLCTLISTSVACAWKGGSGYIEYIGHMYVYVNKGV